MRLGRPLAAASVMAAAIGASLAASPALAGDSLAFKFAEDQQVIVNPSDTAFSVSGTGCTGKDAAVGIALHTSKGEMSTIVKATPDAEGNWSTTLNIPELVKSTGAEAKTDGSDDGWSLVAGCVSYGEEKGQDQQGIAFDDTDVDGTYKITTENGAQKITVDVKGFSPKEKVTLTLVSKSDSSKTYPVGTLTADDNGNVTGELPAPSNVEDGEYTLTIEGDRYGEGGSSTKTVVAKGGSLDLVEDGSNGITDNGGATANPTAPATNGSVNVPASTEATPAASSTSGKPLAQTGANGLLFGGIAAALVAIGGGALVVRRRKA